MRDIAGSAAAPAARLRIRRRGWCVTNRRSLQRGADRHAFAALRIAVFTIASHGNGASLALDVRRLDDRPPLFNLRLLIRAECLRRLEAGPRNFLSLLSKSRTHYWVGQGIDDRCRELGDHVSWRAPGGEK